MYHAAIMNGRRLAARALLVAISAGSIAAGEARAVGINLSWDDCGAAGAATRSSTCYDNGGVNVIVASFLPPAGIDSLIGAQAVVDLSSAPGAMPDWWSFTNPGTCRQSAMAASFDFTSGPTGCTDYWGGHVLESWTYTIGFKSAADRARLVALATTFYGPSDGPGPVDEGTEYYAFKITIDNTNTTGAGLCAGCEVPVCVVFNQLLLQQPGGTRDEVLTTPESRYHVIWQPPRSDCPVVVPARNRTWGSIKAIYR